TMKAVFSQGDLNSLSQCSVPAPLQTEPLDSASFEEASAKAHPQEHASQFVQVAFSARKFQRPQETEEQQLQLLAARYDVLLSHAYECSSLGRLLKDKCEADRISLVAESLGGKAISTLKKRLSSLARMVGWCSNQGMSAFPIDSQVLIEYTQHLQQSGASHSVFGSCIEACNFARFILGVEAIGDPHKHPLVQGRLRKVRFNRPPRVQARPFQVREVAYLEAFVQDSRRDARDRYAAGACLFCIHSRARVGDVRAVKMMTIDFAEGVALVGPSYRHWSLQPAPAAVTYAQWVMERSSDSDGQVCVLDFFDPSVWGFKHGDSCTILGHHSLKDRRSVVTYSRDIQAGLYAKGLVAAGSAEELPVDSVFETEAERVLLPPSRVSEIRRMPPFGRAVDSLIHSAERAAWEDPDAAFGDSGSQEEEPGSSSSSESSSDSGSSDSEIDEVLTASQADPTVGQRYHDRCPVYQQKNTRTLHLKPAGSSMERFICGRDITANHKPFTSAVQAAHWRCKQCWKGKPIRDLGSLVHCLDERLKKIPRSE
ncbi:unnamed protein product, partial [Symbiodinium sp. CCMP2592]